ncbi:MAG: HD-GYP domain-containing protein [Clostridia bacterium]|nr:HD-GYP domain-containing protein [Clostridia bacterium]
MRVVPVEYALGHEVAEAIFDTNGRMLVKKGLHLSEQLILKIKSNGIFSVYINDRFSKNILKPPISEHMKNVTMMEMVAVFEEARKLKLSDKSTYKAAEGKMAKLIESGRDIMYELDELPILKINYTDIKSVNMYTYGHPISVAIMSYIMAQKLKFTKEECENIFNGALFADVGMSFINESLFMKKGKLDVAEFIKIKEHPKLGYDFIYDFYFANTYVKMIVLQHQEKIDGSGYPYGITGDKIHKLAKLVAIADVYGAMTSDRIYARATSSAEAIEYIMGAAGRHFDFDFAKAFVSTIVPYPEGSLVKMNTGHVALVETTNEALPLRPEIRLIDPGRRILEKTSVDLADEKTLIIEGLEYECP